MGVLKDLADAAASAGALTRIAGALERIATAQEEMAGLRQPVDLPEAAIEPLQVAPQYDDNYYAALDELRRWFVRENGREPSPDELMREYDGLPIDPDEMAAALKKKGIVAREG